MKITITGRHFDVTSALKAYVEDKFLRLDKYAPDIVYAQVILQMERKNAVVEANLRLKKFSINVKESNKDMYASIDKVFDVLKKQVVRHEKRLKMHRHRKSEK